MSQSHSVTGCSLACVWHRRGLLELAKEKKKRKKNIYMFVYLWQVFARLKQSERSRRPGHVSSRVQSCVSATRCASLTYNVIQTPIMRGVLLRALPRCQSDKHSFCRVYSHNWLHLATLHVCAWTWEMTFFFFICGAMTYKYVRQFSQSATVKLYFLLTFFATRLQFYFVPGSLDSDSGAHLNKPAFLKETNIPFKQK